MAMMIEEEAPEARLAAELYRIAETRAADADRTFGRF